MLEQYLNYKDKYPDALLFFQVGDFYELFFEDAKKVAATLNLTLTSRDKNDPDPVPMCGVPVSVIDAYLERLVAVGFSVAVVSQVGEVPLKGMVKRELERIVTPGIKILADSQSKGAILVAYYFDNHNSGAFGFIDVQEGIIYIKEGVVIEEVVTLAAKVHATECVIYHCVGGESIDRRTAWVRQIESYIGVQVKLRGTSFIDYPDIKLINGVAELTNTGKKTASLLCNYIQETTVSIKNSVTQIRQFKEDGVVYIDPTTRSNLELVTAQKSNSKNGTLYEILDQTVTLGGSRLLQNWIVAPLCNLDLINQRLQIVKTFKEQSFIRDKIRYVLSFAPEIERISARIALHVASPKEFSTLRDFVAEIPELLSILKDEKIKELENSIITKIISQLDIPQDLGVSLNSFFMPNPPRVCSAGGIVNDGYNEELDKLRKLKNSGKSWISDFENKEKERTRIGSLKIKYHRVIGYYIEIPNSQVDKVPSDYIRRQSTATGERYFVPHLKEMEGEILSAESRQILLEESLFIEFRKEFGKFVETLRMLAHSISLLDIFTSLAYVADRKGYVEPVLDNSLEFTVKEGKHPVVYNIIEHRFVPNDCFFEQNENLPTCFILTGPNMGGKSTYLKQIALITIMAQIGSFVPARSARIGVVDKIFARIGASDNLLEGESTFMVEMKEAALILSNATAKSLVLIDEIGRGTSTIDGEALAQSILEWLVTVTKCRTLFATHFRNLTELSKQYRNIKNISVGSVDSDGDIIFTHQIQYGATNESYGVEVAKMAGLPEAVIDRANNIIISLKSDKTKINGQQILPLSDLVKEHIVKEDPRLKALSKKIEKIDILNTTPVQALQFLDELKKI